MDTDETQINACVMECGGKRNATPLWSGIHIPDVKSPVSVNCLPNLPRQILQSVFVLLFVIGTYTSNATPITASQPIRGGTMRVIQQADFRSLDPAIAFDLESLPFTRLLFRGLLDYDDGVNLLPGQ